jgi:virulence-associated protein VapD
MDSVTGGGPMEGENDMIIEILLIVDMQLNFEAASSLEVRRNVLREIKTAINKKMPIIVLEYADSGKTYYDINKALRNYKNVFYVEKQKDDGSSVLRKFFVNQLHRFAAKKVSVNICGVNTGACVWKTAHGLSRFKWVRSINIIWDACNDIRMYGSSNLSNLFSLIKNCNVRT